MGNVLIPMVVLNVNVGSSENSTLQAEIVLMKNQGHAIVFKDGIKENVEQKMP